MKNALVYSCVLLLLSCGGKTGGTCQSSSTNPGNTGKRFKRKKLLLFSAFSMDFYKGSDWIILIRFRIIAKRTGKHLL